LMCALLPGLRDKTLMTHIVIFEGNSPARVARGLGAAEAFKCVFKAFDPSVTCVVKSPFEQLIGPEDFDGADGVVFTGSGEDWRVDDPQVACQRQAMTLALNAGHPIWGSCNGMQLAALQLGGECWASPNGVEVGLARDIKLTSAGAAHPMMSGRRSGFCVPCIHRDEVKTLPRGAVLLAGNAHSPVQAFCCEQDGVDVWAAQYHPELRPQEIADCLRAHGGQEQDSLLTRDLDAAEQDALAAARLGGSPKDLEVTSRAREIGNWLDHVKAQ
ncbi:MAG: type 1 glutamine amidotransferase, partial [Pseudomonadota bacterium]